MEKVRCALIGSGNMGTDLLYKVRRSPVLEPVWTVGIDPRSEGLARARERGLKTTADGVDGLVPHLRRDGVPIAFEATSAYVHPENSRKVTDSSPSAAARCGVPARSILLELGRRKRVGGQEDMIEDTAMTLAKKRGLPQEISV